MEIEFNSENKSNIKNIRILIKCDTEKINAYIVQQSYLII